MSISLEIATLGRLIETGLVKESGRNKRLLERLETALWIERSGRKMEWRLNLERKIAIGKRLAELLPSWPDEFVFVRSLTLDPYDPQVIGSLAVLKQRNTALGPTNRRNWNAAAGLSPKHRAKLPSPTQLTKDWVLRFRPNDGLKGVFGGQEIDISRMGEILTECVFPERMWFTFELFTGTPPDILITCENLGAYVDLPASPSSLIIYAPGDDIEGASVLLAKFPQVSWVHFGDLDPKGIEIAKALSRRTGKELNLFVPSFAEEYLPGPHFNGRWEDIPNLPVFAQLKKNGHRIFQEVFMLDDRLGKDLLVYCAALPPAFP